MNLSECLFKMGRQRYCSPRSKSPGLRHPDRTPNLPGAKKLHGLARLHLAGCRIAHC